MYDINAYIQIGTSNANVGPEELKMMKQDRDKLLKYAKTIFAPSIFNNKMTVVTNLTALAIYSLTLDPFYNPTAWHNYALGLICIVLKSPNTDEQTAYEISASFYLVKAREFTVNRVLRSFLQSYSPRVVAFGDAPV
jgi:hypothetical protein